MIDSSVSIPQAPRDAAPRWLLLIHQLPPKPDYLRVKVRRRLQKLGAVPLKPSVYVLPSSEAGVEDFQWLRAEIVADGGEATLCEAALLDGITDAEVEELFRRDRAGRYEEIVAEVRSKLAGAETAPTDGREIEPMLRRLRARLDEVTALDYFGTPERASAMEALGALEARLREGEARQPDRRGVTGLEPGRVWVTRRDVHIDRIASAWLIRRFLDPQARFRFVPARGYRPAAGELRFDMYEGEYGHEGERCTFETLVSVFALGDPAVRAIGEIVHDLDFKEEAFGRPETAGIAAMISGLVAIRDSDEARLEHGAGLLDDLHAYFRQKLALAD